MAGDVDNVFKIAFTLSSSCFTIVEKSCAWILALDLASSEAIFTIAFALLREY
jgi:hypothetical protein